MNIIFTVCNRTSLTNALVLGNSVMKYPGSIFYLCWVDTIPLSNLPENIKLINITELDLPEWEQMTAQYYNFELVPACRPWFARHLINLHSESDTFAFMAPTVQLLNSPEEIFRLKGDMLVTPHITSPIEKPTTLDDKRILNIGMFHSGSWLLRKSQESLQFLDWWCIRTIDRAKFDLCNGMCLDQLWLNFTLVRIPAASQISDPGWHYGLHSILNKKITEINGTYFVDKKPLISVDFAGLDFFDPIWSDYAGLANSDRLFKKLHADYKKELRKFQLILPEKTTTATYGPDPQIKSNRLFRKSISEKLKSVTRFIDQF